MKYRIRFSVLLFVMCLLLCITGCDKNPVVDTQPSIPETTLPVTTAAPDPADIYIDAVAALGTNVGMEIKTTQSMTASGQTFTSSCVQTVQFWDLGADAFLVKADDTTDYGEYKYARTEYFSNGAVYQILSNCGFTAEMEE